MARLVATRQRRGIAAVEAAIFFPLLILLVMGMLEYGWLFLKLQCINNAARDGARTGALEGATVTEVDTAIDAVLAGCSIDPNDVTRTLPNVGANPGDLVTCTITVQYSVINLLNLSFFPMPPQLTGTTTMMKEGPPPPPP